MEMSNAEIVRRWKNGALPQKKMVEVLADLNGCTKKEIVKILYEEKQLTSQAIYQYKKSGVLDEEAKKSSEKSSSTSEDEKPNPTLPEEGESEADGDKLIPYKKFQPLPPAKKSVKKKTGKMPEPAVTYFKTWLEQHKERYEAALKCVKTYEEMREFFEAMGGGKK